MTDPATTATEITADTETRDACRRVLGSLFWGWRRADSLDERALALLVERGIVEHLPGELVRLTERGIEIDANTFEIDRPT